MWLNQITIVYVLLLLIDEGFYLIISSATVLIVDLNKESRNKIVALYFKRGFILSNPPA